MQRAIELLESVKKIIIGFGLDMEQRMTKAEARELNRAIDQISESIAELKAPPRWETPEQRKERTGEEWPKGAAIYYRTRYRPTSYEDERWTIWRVAKHNSRKRIAVSNQVQIICATEAGCPPDDWKPEEGR